MQKHRNNYFSQQLFLIDSNVWEARGLSSPKCRLIIQQFPPSLTTPQQLSHHQRLGHER
jgi:hypothetical protein